MGANSVKKDLFTIKRGINRQVYDNLNFIIPPPGMFFEWPDIDTPPLPLNHRVTRGYAPLKNGGSTIRNLRLKVCNGSVKFPRLPAYKIEVRRVCVCVCEGLRVVCFEDKRGGKGGDRERERGEERGGSIGRGRREEETRRGGKGGSKVGQDR